MAGADGKMVGTDGGMAGLGGRLSDQKGGRHCDQWHGRIWGWGYSFGRKRRQWRHVGEASWKATAERWVAGMDGGRVSLRARNREMLSAVDLVKSDQGKGETRPIGGVGVGGNGGDLHLVKDGGTGGGTRIGLSREERKVGADVMLKAEVGVLEEDAGAKEARATNGELEEGGRGGGGRGGEKVSGSGRKSRDRIARGAPARGGNRGRFGDRGIGDRTVEEGGYGRERWLWCFSQAEEAVCARSWQIRGDGGRAAKVGHGGWGGEGSSGYVGV